MKKNNNINVLLAAAEAEPFIKIGGLGDVAGALPSALVDLNSDIDDLPEIDVRLIIPFHKIIKDKKYKPIFLFDFSVSSNDGPVKGKCYILDYQKFKVYLVDGPPIQNAQHPYNNDEITNIDLYTFFSLGLIEIIKLLDWKPNILHANDWHTAISIYQLNEYKNKNLITNIVSIFTIHNLPYMGNDITDIFKKYQIAHITSHILPDWAKKLPLPIGVLNADQTTTVSPTYASQIETEYFGCGLETIFRNPRYKAIGILNGIDKNIWNPQTDPYINSNFDPKTINRREKNKRLLLTRYFNNQFDQSPLIICISRLDHQKGIDILIKSILELKNKHKFNLLLLGSGNKDLENQCFCLEKSSSGNIKFINNYDQKLSHEMYAGGDIFVMPSRYEPCGISQMIAMNYGCIPVAHATGGLKDSIIDSNNHKESTGFLFSKLSSSTLSDTLSKVIKLYKNYPDTWIDIQKNGMKTDFSWRISSQKYYELYLNLLKEHRIINS